MAEFWQSSQDLTDVYAARRHAYIEVFHLASNQATSFKAFITALSDSFSLNYNSENVYGRNDPIVTFAGTNRTISLAWDVPSNSISEAQFNMGQISKLAQFCYPAYALSPEYGIAGAGSLSKPPLVRLKFMNLISGAARGGKITPDARGSGLLGAINGITITPNIEMGFWEVAMSSTYGLLPKVVSITLDFTPQHEHFLGYNSVDGLPIDARFNSFPYNFSGITQSSSAKLKGKRKLSDTRPIQKSGLTQDKVGGGLLIRKGEELFSPQDYVGDERVQKNPYYGKADAYGRVDNVQYLDLRKDKFMIVTNGKKFRLVGYDGDTNPATAFQKALKDMPNLKPEERIRLQDRLNKGASGQYRPRDALNSYAGRRYQFQGQLVMDSLKKGTK